MFIVTKNQAKAKANALHKFLTERGLTLPASDTLNAIARMAGFSDWNGMAAQFTDKAVDGLLSSHEQAHAIDSVESELRAEESGLTGFGLECSIQTASGFWLVTPAYPADVDYVRVCDPSGREVAYWSIAEVAEDASIVLGAVMGALNRSRTDVKPNPLKPSADKLIVADKGAEGQAKNRTGLADLSWSQIKTLSLCEKELFNGRQVVSHWKLHAVSGDYLTELDAERLGLASPSELETLDEAAVEIALDWGDEFEGEGLTVAEIRRMKPGPDNCWILEDGRQLTFYQLTPVA